MIYTGFLERQKAIPSIHLTAHPPFLYLDLIHEVKQARSAVNKQGHRKAVGRASVYAVIHLSKAREDQCSPKLAKHTLLCLFKWLCETQ